MPTRSVTSRATALTVDDVISQMEDMQGPDASLRDSRATIRRITRGNKSIETESIDAIQDIEAILTYICVNPKKLVHMLAQCDAVIAGPQITSFFYPICDFHEWPWDIFCHVKSGTHFIDSFKSFSGCEVVEDIPSRDGTRVVHMRRLIPGNVESCSIRIFVSHKKPMECALDQKKSYEQSVLTSIGAICFWPELQRRGLHRTFSDNPGLSQFPSGTTFYNLRARIGKETSPKTMKPAPSIRQGLSRAEYVIFKNTTNIESSMYSTRVSELNSIVYSTFNFSTRYLGTVANMR